MMELMPLETALRALSGVPDEGYEGCRGLRAAVVPVLTEVERLRAIEARLREMHVGDAEGDCKECEMYYPCPTVRALDGEDA